MEGRSSQGPQGSQRLLKGVREREEWRVSELRDRGGEGRRRDEFG